MWFYQAYEELYHHGIAGMKWGVRRYQNKNGSLTSVGKKRRKLNETSTIEGDKKNAAKKEEDTSVRKKLKDMSDDELRTAINRKRLENDYKTLYPEKVSAGKKFTDVMINKVLIPAATESAKSLAKDYLANQGKKLLQLPTGDNKDKK